MEERDAECNQQAAVLAAVPFAFVLIAEMEVVIVVVAVAVVEAIAIATAVVSVVVAAVVMVMVMATAMAMVIVQTTMLVLASMENNNDMTADHADIGKGLHNREDKDISLSGCADRCDRAFGNMKKPEGVGRVVAI